VSTRVSKTTRSAGRPKAATEFFHLASETRPFFLLSGEALGPAVLAYETYGRLNRARNNAVIVFHALSGSQHATGVNREVPGVGKIWTDECHVGWWDEFVGSGKGIDTDQFFVVCANYLGGCYGSTGPASKDPHTGKPYGPRFPQVTIADIVDSQLALLDHLRIDRLHAAVGASLGGLMALSLASRHPERVRTVIPFATGATITPLQRIHNFEQICAIESDPNFRGGDYYDGSPPDRGLALARMIGHKTFVSLATLEERARVEVVRRDDTLPWYQLRSPIESYLLHQGQKFVKRFDANTYLRILDAWQRFDLAREAVATDLVSLFQRCRKQNYLIFTIDSDSCYYPEEQAHLYSVLKQAGVDATRITVHSDKGHDSFLLEPHLYRPFLRSALNE
jgi:homoserine O-acetyltransferase/O-succinyltransferase